MVSVPKFTTTLSAPVFAGHDGLPAVSLRSDGVDAVLQLVTVGPDGAVFAIFDQDGDPIDVFKAHHPDPLRHMAHLFAKVLSGFSEPAACLYTARLAARYPEHDWVGAANNVLFGMPADKDTPEQVPLFPGLLDAETGLPHAACIERIEITGITKYKRDDQAAE